MQEQANVSLSAFELELVSNPEWILTKNRIMEQVMQLLGAVSTHIRHHPLLHTLPQELTAVPPKISKGENYLGLPYVVLDYPRLFGKEDVFAIRSFFWWGHYFTCTLHLKGTWKAYYQHRLVDACKKGLLEQAIMNRTQEEWVHELNDDQWQPVTTAAFQQNEAGALLKIAFRCEVKQWNEAPDFFAKSVSVFLDALRN
jgi:hypothetical protein